MQPGLSKGKSATYLTAVSGSQQSADYLMMWDIVGELQLSDVIYWSATVETFTYAEKYSGGDTVCHMSLSNGKHGNSICGKPLIFLAR